MFLAKQYPLHPMLQNIKFKNLNKNKIFQLNGYQKNVWHNYIQNITFMSYAIYDTFIQFIP